MERLSIGVQLIVQVLRSGWRECLYRRSEETVMLRVEGMYDLLVIIRVPVGVDSMVEFPSLHIATGCGRADSLHVGHVAGPLTQR